MKTPWESDGLVKPQFYSVVKTNVKLLDTLNTVSPLNPHAYIEYAVLNLEY
jgi:arginine exporter protein ArgO